MADDLRSLSDADLLSHILILRTQLVALEPHIEGAREWSWRSIELLAGTILTGGGFFGAALDTQSLILVPLGFIVWIRAVANDARAMNRHLALRQSLTVLRHRLADAEAELQRRTTP